MNGIKNQNRIREGILWIFMIAWMSTSAFTKAKNQDDEITPHKGDYGYYVDVYKQNEPSNLTPESNPSIGVLEEFLKIFRPGTDWKNGTIVNSKIQKENLTKSAKIAKNRTFAQIKAAYLDDRRDISFSMINGLGIYADEFMNATRAATTIPDTIPEDAYKKIYKEKGNVNETWADENSSYGDMVSLVNTIRNVASDTSAAKDYYKYMRPFRWTDAVTLIDPLAPLNNNDPSKDYGFPSGHTNAAYLTAYGLAYACPEQFKQLLMRASDLGNNRIIAGRHSCLDVMGGRVMATAIAAAALNDPDNKQRKENAYRSGRELLQSLPDTKENAIGPKVDEKEFTKRLTYGLSQVGKKNKPMVVPKGAEVLLETRFPYLDKSQRRYVLYSTGLQSGYPLLDDEEGWGRLNLMAAINGYGSFPVDVTVTMDASKGGYHALDHWSNAIGGTGHLTKTGSGTLILSGNNQFTGGCTIQEGVIDITNGSALGNGTVTNEAQLEEHVNGKVKIKGSFEQSETGNLVLSVANKDDVLMIAKGAEFKGKLTIQFKHGFVPKAKQKLIAYKRRKEQTTFDEIRILGYEDAEQKEIVYKKDGVYLVNKK